MDMYAKYEAAGRLLTQHTRTAVLNGRPSITWVDGSRFFYMRQIPGKEGVKRVRVQVDAATGREWAKETYGPLEEVRYEQETGRKLHNKKEERAYSPDRAYALFTEDHNLMLLDRKSKEIIRLTRDGEELNEYGCYVDIYSQITVKRAGQPEAPHVLWSPDGKYFITYRGDRRACKKLYLLSSYGDSASELRPGLWEYPCPFATDSDEEIPHYTLYVGNAEEKTIRAVDAPDFLYPLFTDEDRSWVRWLDDSSAFYFTWIKRGFQEGRLYLGSPKDGKTKLLVREVTDDFLNLGAFGQVDGYETYLFSNFVTRDRKYAFWQSEKSGYAHLYRFDLEKEEVSLENGTDLFKEAGEAEKKLIVQKLIKVDEQKKLIYFMANNVEACSDPLYYQLYVIGFDGNGLKRLTPEDGVHAVSMGEDAFVDTYSRVDLPPVTLLRRADGSLVRELERADVTALMNAGYQMPERFTVKAGDGVTDLCGILFRPADFDPDKTYPVIDYIYGGAQLYNVPRDFTWDNSMDREIFGGLEEFAQLGFVGIILDGRGTPGRGMEFHKHSYRNIHGCAGLSDHAACMPELKKKFPFIDLERVGIWGNSGGGYATVSAMLKYPKLYKAGVASSGNYDQRIYEHSWTERYYGLYEEELYKQGDITALAGNLEGRLLLAYGAMDDNVTMSQTLRLCDKLNECNKDYELMVLPRMNHNVPSDMYFIRRKMDFFVKYLLGEEPPREFRFK